MTLSCSEFASFLFPFQVVDCSCSMYVKSQFDKDLRYKSFSAKNWVMCKFALCICWRASSSNLWITSWRHDGCEIRPQNLIPFFGLDSPRRVWFWLDCFAHFIHVKVLWCFAMIVFQHAGESNRMYLRSAPLVGTPRTSKTLWTRWLQVLAWRCCRNCFGLALWWLQGIHHKFGENSYLDNKNLWQLIGQTRFKKMWKNILQEFLRCIFLYYLTFYLLYIVFQYFLPSIVACTSPRFTG